MQVQSLGQEDPLEEGIATHSSFMLGEFHGQGSLAGYSPWSYKEDMTEQLTLGINRARKLPSPLELFWKTFNIHSKSALVSPQVALVVKNPPANAGD